MPKKFYKHEYKGKYKFIRRWFDDRSGSDFEQKLDNWLSQFNSDEQQFLLECLKRYSYFRAAEYRYGIITLYLKFLEKYPNWKNDSFIFKIYKSEASYSDNFFNDFWLTNNLKNECKQNIEDHHEDFDVIKNYIFLDDYIGSGNTITNYLRPLLNKYPELRKKSFIILTLYLTNSGKLALENFATDNDIGLDIICYKSGDKFFKEGKYYSGQQLQNKLQVYNKICDDKEIFLSNRFGYENIQSLFTIETNTPNDTLGIFWQNNQNYTSLMTRYKEDESPLTKLIRDKKIKKLNTKKANWIREIDTHQNLLFVGYCARKKTKFNFADTCEKFGLTLEQVNKKIDYAIDKEYLVIQDGKFLETEKFWDAIKKKHYKKYFEDFINEVFEEDILDLKIINYIPLDFDKKFMGYK